MSSRICCAARIFELVSDSTHAVEGSRRFAELGFYRLRHGDLTTLSARTQPLPEQQCRDGLARAVVGELERADVISFQRGAGAGQSQAGLSARSVIVYSRVGFASSCDRKIGSSAGASVRITRICP